MSGTLDRVFSVLELLSSAPHGLPLGAIADRLDAPPSGIHRLLTDLVRRGYVRQEASHGVYTLTTKLAALGLVYLAASGIVDIAQPVLDRLARESGELVRLSVVDGDRLTWVAKAQGAKAGLRYDPDTGMDAHLSCTATGHAWLSCMSDEDALLLVVKQGFGRPPTFGPNAPVTAQALIEFVSAARARGFSMVDETFEIGTAAMAAPVRHPQTNVPIGVISIAGPRARLTQQKMASLAEPLLLAASELAQASLASPSFNPRLRANEGFAK